jgi:hypothetical protein
MLERSERKGHTSFGVAGCPIVRPFPNVNYEEPSNYLGLMRSGGLKTLKNKLGEYVRLAAGGGRSSSPIDRVVAELIPPRDPGAPLPSDAVLAEAIRDGVLTPPLDPDAALPERVPIAPLDYLLAIDATCGF